MDDNDVNDDEEGVGLPVVYALATSAEPKIEQRQITAHDFIHKQAKTRIFDKRHLM